MWGVVFCVGVVLYGSMEGDLRGDFCLINSVSLGEIMH